MSELADGTRAIEFNPGSFRDPGGHVLSHGEEVLRTVSHGRAAGIAALLQSAFYRERGGTQIVATEIVDDPALLRQVSERSQFRLLLKHERVDLISYPFEWPFSLLKNAALFHLDLHMAALDSGFHMSDGSAYNVQFRGCEPIFIDLLSFHDYIPGSYWFGYKQFCEQFLGPLLLTAKLGVPYNNWYRGALNGIDILHVARSLPLAARLSLSIQLHIMLQARLAGRVQSHDLTAATQTRKLSESGLRNLLSSVRKLVVSLQPKGIENTYWREYDRKNSYQSEEMQTKRSMVMRFCMAYRPRTLLDVGCNSGEFSELALASGADYVVGIDQDFGALQAAVSRAQERRLRFLPLYQDLTNPSSAAGWAERERLSLTSRLHADAVIALAVLHHLVIGNNIPLRDAVEWIVRLAPRGVVEFVPPSDPMVRQMLLRRNIEFPDYSEEHFRTALSAVASIKSVQLTSKHRRKVFWYERC
jgi:ribosomal protein L11 methylase PrmA